MAVRIRKQTTSQEMSPYLAKITSVIQSDAHALAVSLGTPLKELAGRTVLITGAGGFLCSFLLDVLAALNDHVFDTPCRVVALDNYRSGVPERIEHLEPRSDFSFVKHDMKEPYEPAQKVDYVIHGASIASPPAYRKFPLETIDVNVNGTRHLLEFSRQNVRSMIHLSTSEIYGDPDPAFVPTPETYLGNVSCTGPRACYDESKRLAETLCVIYHQLYAVPVKIVRPFNVFGPGQRIDDGRIIPDLMLAAINRLPFTLYSDGLATRTFCYIKDAVRAIMLLLVAPASCNGEAFNIGNENPEISIAGVAELVSRIAAPPVLPVRYEISKDPSYVTDSPQRRCPDLTKLQAAVGYQPEVALEEGLARTLASYRELSAEPAFSES